VRKITLASDLHLEFGKMSMPGGDLLALVGDICVAKYFEGNDKRNKPMRNDFMRFFREVSETYALVFYILGNHEHYDGDHASTINILRKALAEFKNIIIMENDTYTIGDTVFVGATLWTDMNKGDWHSMYSIKRGISDFHCVRKNGRKFHPEDGIEYHKYSLETIRRVASESPDKEIVVLTHMGPTLQSIDSAYRAHNLTNGFYVSDLSETILENQNIRYWFHGHTHTKHDYMVGETRVVCNPRGYIGHERIAQEFNDDLTFEIKG